mgnify:FL=1
MLRIIAILLVGERLIKAELLSVLLTITLHKMVLERLVSDLMSNMLPGWGRLHIASNAKFPDEQQMFAAGFLEGALTQYRIYQHYINVYRYSA